MMQSILAAFKLMLVGMSLLVFLVIAAGQTIDPRAMQPHPLRFANPPPSIVKEESDQAQKAAVDEKTIRDLIKQLGDDSFEKREAADKALAAIGEPALILLGQAAKDNPDAEVRQRAMVLMRGIVRTFFTQIRRFDGHIAKGLPWVTRIVVTADGKQAVSTCIDDTALRVWDLESGKQVLAFGDFKGSSWGLDLTPDSKRLIIGAEKVARVFDLQTGKLVQSLAGHTGAIWGAAFVAAGKQAVTGAWDKSLRVWDIETGKELRVFENVTDNVRCLAVSPDEKLLVAGHFPQANGIGTVRLWDIASGKQIRALDGHTKEVSCVAFSPDGKTVLSTSFDSSVRLWDVATGKEVMRFAGHTSRVEYAAFTPDGKRIVSCGHELDPFMRIWDVASGRQLLQSEELKGGFISLAILPDGRHCVTAGRDGVVRLWRWTR